jgi:hypothetical protein
VAGEALYRCIQNSCARVLPRRVNFCPYCGAAQHAGAATARPIAAPPAQQPRGSTPPQSAAPSPNPAAMAGARRATSGQAPRPAPATATVAPPAVRQPVRLRWWLLALGCLWLVWFIAKPSAKKIEARIDHAIALAQDCRSRQAQAELIALRKSHATTEQLRRLQRALNDAAPRCRRANRRKSALSLGLDSQP